MANSPAFHKSHLESFPSQNAEIILSLALAELLCFKCVVFNYSKRNFFPVGIHYASTHLDWYVCFGKAVPTPSQNITNFTYSRLWQLILPLRANCSYMCIFNAT